MKTSIKSGIIVLFMIGMILVSCKKTTDSAPDMGIYEIDSTTANTVDTMNANSDTTAINQSTTGTTGATGKGTTGTTEKGNINNKDTKDSTTTKK